MRTLRRSVALLAMAGALLAVPSSASAADDLVAAGCGFSTARDPSSPHSELWTGWIDGGPVKVVNVNAVSVTVTCSLQANSADPASGDLFTASTVTPGSIGVLAQPLVFTAAPWTAVYLCSRIDWVSDQGAQSFTFDADDTVAGDQCLLAIATEHVMGGREGPAGLGEPQPDPDLQVRQFAIADVDQDGDPESFVTDATQRPGEFRFVTPEVQTGPCDNLAEPDRTICRVLTRICDSLTEPLRTLCRDIVRRIFSTTITLGTGLNLLAELGITDIDLDGEPEIVVRRTADGLQADLDGDGDIDVIWQA